MRTNGWEGRTMEAGDGVDGRTPGAEGQDSAASKEGMEKRLTGLYPKPLEGEQVPISFIASGKKMIGWSPEMGRSVQVEDESDVSALKRVREINEVRVFNWLSGREGLIELDDGEMEELLAILEAKNGEQLVFTRVKVKGRLIAAFALVEGEEPRRWLLSERLDD
ncbi:MAG TPA: hypothetical protein PLJ69_05850 [Methanothrix sp.]|nr:hypothetical protein [Methanothrix sp.]HNT71516.1 hypothetical protein [Methanothrix sp.]HOI68393.1 hypothetical protein [Methanothrix sp.]HPY72746.1 hypothetical protein [Methanothrix sp.]HQA62454.1 hypothetical protein [Methanothrix sp.]